MLSILIPVYQDSITQLVSELVQQGRALDIRFEIIVLDDGSTEAIKKENQSIAEIVGVTYENLPKNLGRSAIRNELGKRAKFPYLLFLDGDSYPEGEHFLKKYVDHFASNTVLVGGTVYSEISPKGKELHWLVGSRREVVPAQDRAENAHHGFSSFNFLVPKDIFQKIKFDETITEYGHEDTLYGWALKKEGVEVVHLENRLIHLGLDTPAIFLEKRQTAIRNLLVLQKKYSMMDTRLLRTHTRLSKWGIQDLMVGLFDIFEKSVLRNLYSAKPRLFLFFWWSLAWLDRTKKGG